MKQIQINNIDDLLNFVKREDVNVNDALVIFKKCINVICVIIVDTKTGVQKINRNQLIDEVEKIAIEFKKDKNFKPQPIIFN